MKSVLLRNLRLARQHSVKPLKPSAFAFMLPGARTIAGLCIALTPHLVYAFAPVREQEMAQCLPGEISTWGDGQDRPAVSSSMRFIYQHASAPAWFSEALVLSTLRKAAAAWSQCGVPSRVLIGATDDATGQDAIRVQWSDAGSRRNFGLADLGQRTLSLGPAAFQLLKTRNPSYDASDTLQMVIAHEMGHLFGLMAHSRRCVDVTSYYDNGRGESCSIRGGTSRPAGVEYRSSLPTACDLQRCRSANGIPPALAR